MGAAPGQDPTPKGGGGGLYRPQNGCTEQSVVWARHGDHFEVFMLGYPLTPPRGAWQLAARPADPQGLGQPRSPLPPYNPQNGCTPLGVTHWLAAAPVRRISATHCVHRRCCTMGHCLGGGGGVGCSCASGFFFVSSILCFERCHHLSWWRWMLHSPDAPGADAPGYWSLEADSPGPAPPVHMHHTYTPHSVAHTHHTGMPHAPQMHRTHSRHTPRCIERPKCGREGGMA